MVKTKRKGGVRTGAGRKGFAEENLARELVTLGANECIKALKRQAPYTDLPVEVVLDLASRFAVKAIPQKIEGEGIAPQIFNIIVKEGSAPNRLTERPLELPA